MNDCDRNAKIDRLEKDVAEIKKDVKALLAFKWQIIGGSIFMSAFFSVVISVIGILTSVKK